MTAPQRPAGYPPDIAWEAEFPERPLDTLLDDSVRRFGDRPCLDFLGRKYSYREVGDLVARAAKGFARLGVGPGVHVGLHLPNTPFYVICYYAVLKAGGTVVNFNPLYVEHELIHQIEDAQVGIMVTLDLKALYGKLAPLLGRTRLARIVVCRLADALPFPKNLLFPLLKRAEIASVPDDPRHVRFGRLIANDGAFERPQIDPRRSIAVLQYTGGTTGTPKGAMLTHYNLVANATQCHLWFNMVREGDERTVAVIPFFHVFAMTTELNFGIKTGAELAMIPRFDLELLLQTIDRVKPSFFPAVPTIFTAIKNHKNLARYDLSSIRRCISGGAPLPLEVKAEFEALTGCEVVEGYGLSETSPVATCNPLGHPGKAGSIGLPVPGTLVEIVSLDDPEIVLGTGERGEIRISGPQVMAGYWEKPEETARCLKDGKLRTGDVGYIDEEGFIFLVDRIKDMIIAGGYNVYPRNVEEAIYQHPAVLECCVVGVPDPYRGQTVKAFIVLREGAALEPDALRAFLADKLSPIEMPKLVEFRATLPKTAIGKISRKDLAAEEAARTKAEAAKPAALTPS